MVPDWLIFTRLVARFPDCLLVCPVGQLWPEWLFAFLAACLFARQDAFARRHSGSLHVCIHSYSVWASAAAASWLRRPLGFGRPFAATDLASVGGTALPAPTLWLCCAASGGCIAPRPFLPISWARTPKAHFWRKWAFCVRVGEIRIFGPAVPCCGCRLLPLVSQSQILFTYSPL